MNEKSEEKKRYKNVVKHMKQLNFYLPPQELTSLIEQDPLVRRAIEVSIDYIMEYNTYTENDVIQVWFSAKQGV